MLQAGDDFQIRGAPFNKSLFLAHPICPEGSYGSGRGSASQSHPGIRLRDASPFSSCTTWILWHKREIGASQWISDHLNLEVTHVFVFTFHWSELVH